MTLKEWSDATGILPVYPTIGAVSVAGAHISPHYASLWYLSDHYVSTVAGVVVWLVPRKSPCGRAVAH